MSRNQPQKQAKSPSVRGFIIHLAKRMRPGLRRISAWIHPRRYPWRLLMLCFILSLPKLLIVARVPDHVAWKENWDEYHILESLKADSSLGAVQGWFHGDWVEHNSYYRPLTSVSLWFDYLIWGQAHRGFLLTSWVLQVITGWLVALLAFMVLRNAPCAVLAAVSASVVIPVSARSLLQGMSGRTDGLCAVFMLVALLAALEWFRTGRRGWFATMFGASLAALLSKEMAVTLPALIVLCALFGARGSWRQIAAAVAVCAVLVALYLLAYQTFVPERFESRQATLSLLTWRRAWLFGLHSLPVLFRFIRMVSSNFSVYCLLIGEKLTIMVHFGCFVGALAATIVVIPAALGFFVGWEVICRIPLISVQIGSMHYNFIPNLVRHILYAAMVYSIIIWGDRRLGVSK